MGNGDEEMVKFEKQKKKEACAEVRQSGYWKGWPCGSVPKYKWKGLPYCGVHYAAIVNRKAEIKAAVKGKP